MEKERNPFKRWLQRSESGQAVVLLAIGFIALTAFVGITTDISLMFVRYAQLSRSIDSAAIAAANQLRQDRSMATVGLAARQFIEFHGLDPEAVIVDTCLTAVDNPNTPADETAEVCTDDQAKLVRVRAHIKSPTVFMRLLGFQDFDLWASSVSQTAALDVVLIMDVSESMLRYTSVEDWANIQKIGDTAWDDYVSTSRQGVIYRPPTVNETLANMGFTNDQVARYASAFWADGFNALGEYIIEDADNPGNALLRPDAHGTGQVLTLLEHPQIEVNERLTYVDANGGATLSQGDPAYRVLFNTEFLANTPGLVDYDDNAYGSQDHPREDCRVRFYPSGVFNRVSQYNGYTDPSTEEIVNLDTAYAEAFGANTYPDSNFGVFVPSYDFYGCCNDPDGDGTFDDLICQPFKQARDATFQFLERIDFIRGDRAAFVNFDRSAYLINPFGEFADGSLPGAMIETADDAFLTVRNLVGVRAEPNFYMFESGQQTVGVSPITAEWTSFAAGLNNSGSVPIDYTNTTYDPYDGSAPESYNYPVNGNCPFNNASQLRQDRTLFYRGLTQASILGPEWDNYSNGGQLLYYPDGNGDPRINPNFSYEMKGSCRGTNMGAALREGNNALLDPATTRRFGTVWIMVLLSDGAAGASDAVRRNNAKIAQAAPYAVGAGVPSPSYGAYGLCPYGTRGDEAELMTLDNDSEVGGLFPFCSDESPQTRHRCDFRPFKVANEPTAIRDVDYDDTESVEWNRTRGNFFDVEISDASCLQPNHYDVDDYARDWADYIGLDTYSTSGATALLPTMFTIGFGLEFPNRDGGSLDITDQANAEELCRINAADCLGEQLLRYIADVGDNNSIDNDWYQDWLDDFQITGRLVNSSDFGRRDPCQSDGGSQSPLAYNAGANITADEEAYMYEPLRPTASCGNYYYAPDGNELQFVFDDIASRMFTRLTR